MKRNNKKGILKQKKLKKKKVNPISLIENKQNIVI